MTTMTTDDYVESRPTSTSQGSHPGLPGMIKTLTRLVDEYEQTLNTEQKAVCQTLLQTRTSLMVEAREEMGWNESQLRDLESLFQHIAEMVEAVSDETLFKMKEINIVIQDMVSAFPHHPTIAALSRFQFSGSVHDIPTLKMLLGVFTRRQNSIDGATAVTETSNGWWCTVS